MIKPDIVCKKVSGDIIKRFDAERLEFAAFLSVDDYDDWIKRKI
ncbi:MAG: hypothetical protein LBD46_05360 [Endomicrobium sp.]|nr:hypothetical protein [Endomicrobium sp.]